MTAGVCLLAVQTTQAALPAGIDAVTGATEQVDNKVATPASVLQKRLQKLQKRGIMVGHQDDTMYGTTWKWEEGKSDVLLTVDDYPAVMGFDLGRLELDGKENLDGVPFDRMRKDILAQHARGGIVTLSWHPWNPVTGENAWDPKGDAVKEVLEGKQKEKFESWLGKVATFINSLQTCCGEKVPVIFRPWHEMNGGWFWWGANSCTPQQYVALYKKTYERLKAAGCDNLVWAWSPNLGDAKTVDAFLERYPGNDVVDMVGVDIYEFDGNDANYAKNLKETLDVMVEAGKKTGKMVALTETGCRGIAQKKDWFTKTLLPVIKDYSLSYVLFWRNAWDKPQEEAYLPGVGDGDIVEDFKAFKSNKKILFAKDIVKVKK